MAGNQEAFFALVRAGLWGDVKVNGYRLKVKESAIDWGEVYRLAEEQAVVGVVAAGIERLNVDIPLEVKLQFVGSTLQIEQRNKAMNEFIAVLVNKLRIAGVYTLLVKGQGIAQCYEKPLWRASGDVDFLLSDENYKQAKETLAPLAASEKPERRYSKEIGFYIDQWLVELHGTLHTGLASRVDKSIDAVQKDIFYGGNVRSIEFKSSRGATVQVFLPGVDNDVFIVFTHFLKHFYKEGGVSVRQLCDWCRLIYTYRESLNHGLLESRIRKAGLMDEWRAFAAVAVGWLGMPKEAMPLYSEDTRWSRKASRIVDFVLKGGEWHKWRDTLAVARIFPWNTLRFAPGILLNVNWMKVKERMFGK